MSDSNQQARLAALASRRAQSSPTPEMAVPAEPAGPAQQKRGGAVGLPSAARICATAVSTVSFAAMIAAMGPLVAEASDHNNIAPVGMRSDPVKDVVTAPTAPRAAISLAPSRQKAPTGLPAGSSTTTASAMTQPDAVPPQQPAPQPVPDTNPAPVAPAPTAAPTTTAPPTSAAPVTQTTPSTTAAPNTAAPAPTTAPPPPKSGASG
jgi:hypothetical protein